MQKKTGSEGSIVAPAAPTAALEADTADPGETESAKSAQRATKKGKYGSLGAIPKTPLTPAEAAKLTWIGIELKDNDGKAVPGVRFEVRGGPDEGVVGGGTTDPEGKGRVEGVVAGKTYKIAFPELDEAVWEPA